MTHTAEESTALWQAGTAAEPLSPLTESITAPVCIIGAGIAGLTTAYLLGRAGKQVVVLDDGPVSRGETGRSTAHISNAFDDRYFEVARMHGEAGARIVAESHSVAIDTIERIVRDEAIDCGFQRLDGYLFRPPGDNSDILHREMEACLRAGVPGVTMVERGPAFDTGPCLRFPDQGQFDPFAYARGLARCIERDGGRIFTGSRVEGLDSGPPARIRTAQGYVVTADAAVVATSVPANDRIAIHAKQSAWRTYVIAAPLPKGQTAPALYWDTLDIYHYVRIQPGESEDWLIVGGEDHRTGQRVNGAERYARLEAWSRERFPAMGAVAQRWSGQIMEPADLVAFIGRNPMDEANIFIATGDSGNGITHGTIAGLILTELIQGRGHPWAKLYDPSRITAKAAGDYASDNLHVAEHYADWLTGGDVHDIRDIPLNSGAVIRDGLRKIAVYRDEAGVLHKRSAVCRHLKCIVTWNDAEKSWDCPCHGSRYDRYGRVVNGPAMNGLSATED